MASSNSDKDLADQLFNEYMDSLDKFSKAVNQILGHKVSNSKKVNAALRKQKKVLLK